MMSKFFKLLFFSIAIGSCNFPQAQESRLDPVDDWVLLSKLLSDTTISSNWRDVHEHSIIYLHLRFGSEATAINYLKQTTKEELGDKVFEEIFYFAIMKGFQQTVKVMINMAEMPTFVFGNGESPLMVASYFGHLEIMRMFISSGVDIHLEPSKNRNALVAALEGGHVRAVYLLIDHGISLEKEIEKKNWNLIYPAILGKSMDTLRLLILTGFDLNTISDEGQTPLMFAIELNSGREIIKMLLQYGAKSCIKDKHGVSPIQLVRQLSVNRTKHEKYEYERLFKNTDKMCTSRQ